jgi:hypothetical protein
MNSPKSSTDIFIIKHDKVVGSLVSVVFYAQNKYIHVPTRHTPTLEDIRHTFNILVRETIGEWLTTQGTTVIGLKEACATRCVARKAHIEKAKQSYCTVDGLSATYTPQ